MAEAREEAGMPSFTTPGFDPAPQQATSGFGFRPFYVGGVPTKPMKPQRLKKGGIASPKAKPKKMKKGGLASSRKK